MNTRRMHLVLIFQLAILWLSVNSVIEAQQATMQFPVARDNSIAGWENHNGYGVPPVYDKFLETEEFSNFGASLAVRARKADQHAVIMDWDTEAITAFIAANVDQNQPMRWTLNVYPLDGPIDDIPIETLESLKDWFEGNGGLSDFDGDGDIGEYENFNWEPDTKASTNNFAQTAFVFDDDDEPILDLENSLPWVDNDLGTGGIDDDQYGILGRPDHFSRGLRIPDFVNTEWLLADNLFDAAADATYASVSCSSTAAIWSRCLSRASTKRLRTPPGEKATGTAT